jgi:hypothetical protein
MGDWETGGLGSKVRFAGLNNSNLTRIIRLNPHLNNPILNSQFSILN